MSPDLNERWEAQGRAWRDPAGIVAQWSEAGEVDPALLKSRVSGAWWQVLAELGITLLVSREYEHLILALGVRDGKPMISLLRLPHPSGIAVDRVRGEVHIASTRNPNAVYTLRPATGLEPREGTKPESIERPLVPVTTRFLPGSTYLHDLAMIDGVLHANSVGSNSVVRLAPDQPLERVWWPRCIEHEDGPAFGRNHLQVNSIAAGPSLAGSFFTASTDRISARRPGHRNWVVDRRGVLFSGATRHPVVRGLTRPHSARFAAGSVWLDDSGYGTVGVVDRDRYEPLVKLPGWTRGLCAVGPYLIVGTSRVIPRFRQYAPGLDVDQSVCGLHAVERGTGRVAGSLIWPAGNQIFAIERVPTAWATGLPFAAPRRAGRARDRAHEHQLFFAWQSTPEPMVESEDLAE